MKKTFKQIIEEFENFTNLHYQTHEFGWGDLSNISTKDHTFPMIWLQPIPGSNEGHTIMLEFEMYVIDLLKQNDENKLDVYNDTLLIGNDVIANFFDNEQVYGLTLDEEDVPITPFYAKFDDYTAGWIFEITLEIDNKLNYCAVPLEGRA